MTEFTPLTASIGGALIGLAAAGLMALNGRIAGISGVLSGAATGDAGDRLWRILFVAGLVLAPPLWQMASGNEVPFEMTGHVGLIAVGGLLVGFGTRLGSGCTSGHGVCGLSRLSPRSMVAVAVFMVTGMTTVVATKSLGGG